MVSRSCRSGASWHVANAVKNVWKMQQGSKKTTWKGSMTLETFPHLEALGKIPGVADFLGALHAIRALHWQR